MMPRHALASSWRAACFVAPVLVASLLAGCQALPPGEQVIVPPGPATRLHSVYWLDRATCTSLLRTVTSVTVTAGNDEGLALSLVPATGIVPVQCPAAAMPGADVMIRTTRPFATPETRDITYVVVYDTTLGNRNSTHTRRITVLPQGAAGAPRPAT